MADHAVSTYDDTVPLATMGEEEGEAMANPLRHAFLLALAQRTLCDGP